MNKYLPVFIIAALVIVGVGAYLVINRGTTDTSTGVTPSDTTTSQPSNSDTFIGSLKDAVSLGVAMKCTYQVEGSEYEGYIKGENYRGQIKTAEGKVGEVIIKDSCMWTWAEDETQGIKTCFEDSETEEADIWEQPQGSVSPGINYTCLPAAVTDNVFTPPTDIDFMDIDTMMEGFGY